MTSAEAVEAVVRVHVAVVDCTKAEFQQDYCSGRVSVAREEARNEVGLRERVPDEPWEVDFWRAGIVVRQEPQSSPGDRRRNAVPGEGTGR